MSDLKELISSIEAFRFETEKTRWNSEKQMLEEEIQKVKEKV